MQDWGHDCLSSARYSALLDKIRLLSAEEESRAGVETSTVRWTRVKTSPSSVEVRCLKEQGRIDKEPPLFVFTEYPFPFYSCITDLSFYFQESVAQQLRNTKSILQSTHRPDSRCVALKSFYLHLQPQWSRSQAADLYSPKTTTIWSPPWWCARWKECIFQYHLKNRWLSHLPS